MGKGSSPEKQRSRFLLRAALHNWTQQAYNGGQGIIENVDLLGCASLCAIHSETSVFRRPCIFNGQIFLFCLASSGT